MAQFLVTGGAGFIGSHVTDALVGRGDRVRVVDSLITGHRRNLAHLQGVEILEGDRYVHAHSYRADEILQLLRVAEEFGFKIRTLQHVLEGYRVADEIAAHGAGASTFSDWWAHKVEAYEAIDKKNLPMLRQKLKPVTYTPAQLEEFRRVAGKPVWDKWVEENKARCNGQELIDTILKIARETGK